MDWDKLRIFYTVAQAQSLTKAGELLALTQSAVSRQISALEERLGISLFRRHARGLLLTEQGEILFKTVCDMVSKLQATEVSLSELSNRPKGPFAITAPVTIGTIWLSPLLKEFSDLYPDIEITLLLDDRELDLAMREADVAIRLRESRHPDLIQKQLIRFSNSIYASNDYLREFGIPRSVEELSSHHVLAYASHIDPPFDDVNWFLELPEVKAMNLNPRIRMNNLSGLRRAVKAGMGIAALPDHVMYRTRHISKVLLDVPHPQTPAYYVYPAELKNSKRVAVFRQFIQRKMAEFNF